MKNYMLALLIGLSVLSSDLSAQTMDNGFDELDTFVINVLPDDESVEIDEETEFPIDFFDGHSVDVELLDLITDDYFVATLTPIGDGLILVAADDIVIDVEIFALIDAATEEFEILLEYGVIPISSRQCNTVKNPLIRLLAKLAKNVFKRKPPLKKPPVPKAGGLKKQLDAHKKKLDDYIRNPDAFDNKGILKDASPELRKKIIDGRIKNLKRQIENFKKQIEDAGG